MPDHMIWILGSLGALTFIGALVVPPCWPVIAVAIIRHYHLRVYPMAIGIAMMIHDHPDQWTTTKHEMSHSDIGTIWTANGVDHIAVTTESGKWRPNAIERQIIYEAVDWRIRRYVADSIGVSVRRNLLATTH